LQNQEAWRKEYRVQARLTSHDDKHHRSEFHQGSGRGQNQTGVAARAHDLPNGWTPLLFDRISQKSDPKDQRTRKAAESDHENVTGHAAADNGVHDNQQGVAKSKDTAQEK
jgi:hypothetical protein